MARSVTTHLMFEGAAEEAMTFYMSLFSDSRIVLIDRYGEEEMGKTGTVKHAIFTLCGREYHAIDSPVEHAFTFTPAMSFFIDCESESELDQLFARLSESGQVLMPVSNYGFSRRFGWLQDRFGVSWQLNLP